MSAIPRGIIYHSLFYEIRSLFFSLFSNLDNKEEVRNFDPRQALTDYADGYVFYRRFAKKFDDIVSSGGYILLEIGGVVHKEGVEKIFSKAGLQVKFYKDLQGDFRVAEVRK